MSKFFINRPIVAMVISIVMVLVGSLTVLTLPVAQFPNITPPEIQVQAVYVVRTRRPSNKPWPRPSSNR